MGHCSARNGLLCDPWVSGLPSLNYSIRQGCAFVQSAAQMQYNNVEFYAGH